MRADNYMLIRQGDGGFLVTMESMSREGPLEDFDTAKERIMGVRSKRYEGFFDLERQAEAFLDHVHKNYFVEYGDMWTHRDWSGE